MGGIRADDLRGKRRDIEPCLKPYANVTDQANHAISGDTAPARDGP
jgi:hypothetical protein